MKTTLLFSFLFIISSAAVGQDRYQQEMEKALTGLDQAQVLADFKAVANKFELIAGVEKQKWLPQYYAAYTNTVMTYFDKDKDGRDASLDKAQQYLDIAEDLNPGNRENEILQAYIYQSRFFIAPMNRLSIFNKASSAIADALDAYKNNPRANLLQGIQMYHKPGFMGGGASKAKPYFSAAKTLYATSSLDTKFSPNWGVETNDYYLSLCKD
ncbi:MAG: hypothetical protein ABJM06_10215 [Gilvibacter sp.]